MEEEWSFPYNIRIDFILDTYGQKGYKIWEAQPLRHGEKTHDEGTKVTLIFWKSEICNRAEKHVQVSTLSVWRGEDRKEVLKCVTSAFS